MPHTQNILSKGAKGAFVTAFALATDAAEFTTRLEEEACDIIGLAIVELDNVRPYAPHEDDDGLIKDCLVEISAKNTVCFNSFHN